MDSGQPSAFEAALTQQAYEGAWRYCLRLTGSREAAEDLLHESLAHAILRFRQLKDPALLRGWLLSIVRTQHLQQLRRSRRSAAELLLLDGDMAALLAADAPVSSELLLAALQWLPAAQRELLEFYYILELDLRETAAALRLKPNTVKQRLLRARAALRRELEKTMEPGELAAYL